MLPAVTVLKPFDLVICKLALGLTSVATEAVLLVMNLSLPGPPTNVGLPDTVRVFVAEPRMLKVLLPRCVTVMVQKALGGAVANVPVICNRPPTTAVAVVQLPPPVGTAVIAASDGVSRAGMVSVKVVVAVMGPRLLMVSMYCIVPPPGTVIGPVVVTPAVPMRWFLSAWKSDMRNV